MNAAKVLDDLKRRFPNEPEYHQAVEEVLSTIEEEYNKHPEFDKVNLIERLCIPDRVYQFRVTWIKAFSFAFFFLLVYDGIDHGYGCDIHNVADRTFEIGEVDRFVQSHLDRADEFCIRVHCLQQFVTGVC